jgi:hypothetical protein
MKSLFAGTLGGVPLVVLVSCSGEVHAEQRPGAAPEYPPAKQPGGLRRDVGIKQGEECTAESVEHEGGHDQKDRGSGPLFARQRAVRAYPPREKRHQWKARY